ncbi:hypothetical protein NHH88_12150 [Oxalobacteraceae bacterium OTU3CAMAD1]|nr:hypothetical protein NHH88_12150 [Oxalobacteraceae bacterium OTU3CAMAD1]
MNEFQQYYGQQLAPQQMGPMGQMGQMGGMAPMGFLGGMFGAPLGGLIGRGIGGLFGNAKLGNQIGQMAGGIGGSFLPLGVDPVSAAYAQQQQLQQLQLQQQLQQQQMMQQMQQPGDLSAQGWFGNMVKQVARPLGGAIGGAFGNAGMGNTIGGIAGQLGGMLPFGADPMQAYAQAQQEAQLQQLQLQGMIPSQSWFSNLMRQQRPFTSAISPTIGNTGIMGPRIGSLPTGQNHNFLPFSADPMAQAYAMQEAQMQQMQQMQDAQGLMPQGGWFGNLIKNVAQPLGGAIGGAFGNAGMGNAIGGIAGQLGGMLPFGTDPITAAYAQQAAQQAQLAQLAQQQVGNGAMYGGQQTLH